MPPQTPGLPQAPPTPNETTAVLAQAATVVDAACATRGHAQDAIAVQVAIDESLEEEAHAASTQVQDDDEQPLAAAGRPPPGSAREGVTEENHPVGARFSFGETYIKAAVDNAENVAWWARGLSDHEVAGKFAVVQQLHIRR